MSSRVSQIDRRWLALAALAVAQFMVFLDETVVNVALPSIKVSLGFSQGTLAWVVSAYIVVFGGLVLLGGRLADLFGRRRVFLIGTAVFGVASVLDGWAQSQAMLLGARVLQGVGAALATPAALALVTALFTDKAERMKALTVWGALSGLGFAIGILLGGAITEAASWRWVFLINVPIAAGSLFVIPRIVAESQVDGTRRFNLTGGATVTVGLSMLVFAIVKAPAYGWGSVTTLSLGGVAVGLLAAFAVIQRRSTAPLIPTGFLTRRATVVPNLLQLLIGLSLLPTLFLLTLYTQQVLHYTPLEAGVAYLPLAAGVAMASGIAQKLVERAGPRPLAAAGLTIAGIGMALLSQAPVAADYWTQVLPAIAIMGVGAGLSFVSVTTAALASVDDQAGGIASGLLSTTVQVGGALGVALLVGVVVTQRAADLIASGSTAVAAEAGGLRLAFMIASAGATIASLIAAFAMERKRSATDALETTNAGQQGAITARPVTEAVS
jgi:EmrB/QacA subfamily drug resistance transporter